MNQNPSGLLSAERQRAVVKDPDRGTVSVVTLTGRIPGAEAGGVRIAERQFHSLGVSDPKHVTRIPDVLAGLLDDAYERLREYYPDVLTEENRGAVYLSVLEARLTLGSDANVNAQILRDAVERKAEALQHDQGLAYAFPRP
jgi:hypothetical protein